MRKKILALGLALSTMMVCFTGCGEDEIGRASCRERVY